MTMMKTMKMKKRVSANGIIQACMVLFFLFCVILPIVSMLCRITPDGLRDMTQSPQFLPAVRNSLTTALTAAVISMLLALAAAWCMERTRIRGRAVFGMLFVIPMLIPSISHAFGLVALFGNNGLFTKLLGWDVGIYGFWGIVVGSVMYSFPVAFLMLSGILQYEDGMTDQAARVLGIPRFRRFLGITLPYMKKTLISAFFAVFTMIVTDYGVPLMVGGKQITLSVLMYQRAVALIDYDSGSVIGACLLIPAVIAFLVDLCNPEHGQGGYVSEPVVPEKSRLSTVLSYLWCTLLSLLVLAPIFAFCMMVFQTKYPVDSTFTFEHIEKTFHRGADEYLLNSLLYALLAALFGTLLAFVCSYLTARSKGVLGKCVHLFSITSMAIPGIVLGLSYVIFFHSTPIYGTVLIVALANSVHFFASPYLMMYNTLQKVNPNLEAVGQSLGVGRFRIVRDVILPKVRYTLLEMFVYFFVNSMMTISAVSFLAPPSPKPVALMINQFEAQLLMESAAVVSLLILLINLLLKLAASLLRRNAGKE